MFLYYRGQTVRRYPTKRLVPAVYNPRELAVT